MSNRYQLGATRCPSDDLSLTNRIFVNGKTIQTNLVKYLRICPSVGGQYVFAVEASPAIPEGKVGFTAAQRKWANLSIGQELECYEHTFDPNSDLIGSAVLMVNLYGKQKSNNPNDFTFNTDELAAEFSMQFSRTPLSIGQQLNFCPNKERKLILEVTVKQMEVLSLTNKGGKVGKEVGLIMNNTVFAFDRAPESYIILRGKALGSESKAAYQSIINPDWDFNQMGIGGLDKEFSDIFRRAFASRVLPPDLTENMGMKHVRGILLYGPPGTGKTLIARQIGKMLNAREPKIVNGPEILDKYVGESEANIRKLFADAEEESKRMGLNSALHIIIFDEIDAICKTRGSVSGGTGVNDAVVNQLLTKIDGVGQLNNILVIGMTNRKDMIDEALTRPGRLEVQMEISLPDEKGRVQILNIHTSKLRENKKLDDDVNIEELAKLTKNFTGAEIEGLCRAAASTAVNRLIKVTNKVVVDANAYDTLCVTRNDFLYSLKNDVKAAFGAQEDDFRCYLQPFGLINWGEPFRRVTEELKLGFHSSADNVGFRFATTMLLEGPFNSGKTAIAVDASLKSEFPFIKMCTAQNMIGFTESAKCMAIKKIFDDASKSKQSIVILDEIESLIGYNRVGFRYSSLVTEALHNLVKRPLREGSAMIILATTSAREALQELNMLQLFHRIIHVPNLNTADQLIAVLEEAHLFQDKELQEIKAYVEKRQLLIGIRQLITDIQAVIKIDMNHRVNVFCQQLESRGFLEERFN